MMKLISKTQKEYDDYLKFTDTHWKYGSTHTLKLFGLIKSERDLPYEPEEYRLLSFEEYKLEKEKISKLIKEWINYI